MHLGAHQPRNLHNELVHIIHFSYTVRVVCRICRLALDVLHIRISWWCRGRGLHRPDSAPHGVGRLLGGTTGKGWATWHRFIPAHRWPDSLSLHMCVYFLQVNCLFVDIRGFCLLLLFFFLIVRSNKTIGGGMPGGLSSTLCTAAPPPIIKACRKTPSKIVYVEAMVRSIEFWSNSLCS